MRGTDLYATFQGLLGLEVAAHRKGDSLVAAPLGCPSQNNLPFRLDHLSFTSIPSSLKMTALGLSEASLPSEISIL